MTNIITFELDAIATDIESQDPQIALALDRISDRIEKRAYFNPRTWLPGRTYRDNPVMDYPKQSQKDREDLLYVCSSCNTKAYTKKCPHCGGMMQRV